MTMFQKATKRAVKARVALDGPTGSGKTWTALTWAKVLGARIALVDTERGSASLYSDHFDFDVLEMTPPYDPERLIEAIQSAEKADYEVIVIDSLSHFWEGEGGTLDIADAAAQRSGGNSFAGWKVATPALRHLVDVMLGLDAHLIVTMRSKMEYVLEEDGRGKKVPKKVGMAPVMRGGVEYEFTLVADLDLEHRLTVSKSRCDLLADQVYQPGRADEGAQTFLKWLNAGEPVASRNDVDALVSAFKAIDDDDARTAAKKSFVERFGRPEHLLASQLEEARKFVADLTGGEDDPPPEGGAQLPTNEGEGADDTAPEGDDSAAAADAEEAPGQPIPAGPVSEPEPVHAEEGSGSGPTAAAAGATSPPPFESELPMRLAKLDAEHRKIAVAAWQEKNLPPMAELPEDREQEALALLVSIGNQQQAAYDKRRRAANAAMTKVGVKGDEARHELVAKATAGFTNSTAALSESELEAIKAECERLAAEDRGEEAVSA